MSFDDVELRHLRALRAVAEEGSFIGAADILGFSQAAISQQIAGLERAVGQAVFDRPGGPRPVTLTPAGRILLRYAEDINSQIEAAEPWPTPDPGDYHPEPEWYFLFLFKFLALYGQLPIIGKIEWLATVLIPGIAIAILTLLTEMAEEYGYEVR
mgnify:CR=1 FL=1